MIHSAVSFGKIMMVSLDYLFFMGNEACTNLDGHSLLTSIFDRELSKYYFPNGSLSNIKQINITFFIYSDITNISPFSA